MKKHYTIAIDADRELQLSDEEILNAIHAAIWDRVKLASLAKPEFEVKVVALDAPWSDDRGRIGKDVKLTYKKQVNLAHQLKDRGYSVSSIAHIMRTNKIIVRILLTAKGE
jgi:hypothetical protein